MSAELSQDTCLQCEQTRAGVKRDETFCGIESGYEYIELEAEWPRHHWRNWSNRELDGAGIKPEARERYRRVPLSSLPYAACGDRIRGHNRIAKTDPELMFVAGQCWDCGHIEASTEALV